MRARYASKFVCDFCGTAAEVSQSVDNETISYDTIPDGWTAVTNLTLNADIAGAMLELCRTCSAIPFSGVIARIIREHKRVRRYM